VSDLSPAAGVDVVYDEMVDTRRVVHRRPELAFQEHATTALIRERMGELGIDELSRVTETGGIFALDGGRPGRPVVLRADIDGLPVHESETFTHHSEVDGTMHACGHDVHVASLLGVARALTMRQEELSGRYIFLFQPAEEALGGAKAMIEGGALAHMEGARLIGFHVTSVAPTGMVALRSGIAMSEAHMLKISITGPGGHGAMPNATGDVIKAMAALLPQLGGVVEGLHYERADCICSAGTLHAGTAANVVSTTAVMTGTLRTFTDEQRVEAFGRLRALCESIGESHGVGVTLEVLGQCSAVVNDEATTDLVELEAKGLLGPERVMRMPPSSPSDDVSEFLHHMPGCYFFVGGARADGTSGSHHSPSFAVEDESLRVSAGVVLRSALALAAP